MLLDVIDKLCGLREECLQPDDAVGLDPDRQDRNYRVLAINVSISDPDGRPILCSLNDDRANNRSTGS